MGCFCIRCRGCWRDPQRVDRRALLPSAAERGSRGFVAAIKTRETWEGSVKKPADTYVYRLRCPIDGRVRYVGISRNPIKRLGHHTCTCGYIYEMREWMILLRKKSLEPLLEVITPPLTRAGAVSVESRLALLFSTLYPKQLFNLPATLRNRRITYRGRKKVIGQTYTVAEQKRLARC